MTTVFIAIVHWTEIRGGSMWDMHDFPHSEIACVGDTYEAAMEGALPLCQKKTEWMLSHGYLKGAHARIEIRDEILLTEEEEKE